MSNPIKVFIVDDHEIVLDGLMSILNPVGAAQREIAADDADTGLLSNGNRHPFQLMGKASSGADLLERIAKIPFIDVIVMDYALGDMTGLEAAAQVRMSRPTVKVVLFSMYSSDALIKDVFAHGVEGYVTKGEGRRRLLEVIKRVHAGEKVYPDLKNNAGIAIPSMYESPALVVFPSSPLSKREVEVLCEITNGLTSDKISKTLNIAFNTVEVHRANISKKLNLKGIAELTKYALEHDLCKNRQEPTEI